MRTKVFASRLLASSALALLSAVTMTGCKATCTEVGCLDGINVELNAPLDIEGDIAIRIVTDGETLACALGENRMCPPESGITIASEAGRMSGFFVRAKTEAAVSIEILRDDKPIASESFTPLFEEEFPNGEDCPAQCSQAQHKLR